MRVWLRFAVDEASKTTSCAVTLSGAVPVQLPAVAHEASEPPVQVAAKPEALARTARVAEVSNKVWSLNFIGFVEIVMSILIRNKGRAGAFRRDARWVCSWLLS